MNLSRSYILKNILRLAVLVLCIGLLGTAALAQSTTAGAIGGTVVDPQNAVVPNAVVTITNTGTNQTQTATTNETGAFRVVQLQPGTYTVAVKAKGFAPYKAENVIVNVGSLTPINPHMTIGTTEHVEVTAEAPVINVTSSEFAPTLNEKAIQNLPINGGRWSSFVMLTPGVVSDSSGFGLVSFRGMSTLLNNVTVDGADNNQAYFSEERGRTRAGYSTPKTAVQEFQVNTSNYSSEYGRSAGGVINTVTKSGTNQLHGDAYWYDRDNSWGSYNPFTTLTSVTNDNGNVTSVTSPYKPKDVRKMGGFGVGGAIVKDKLFWFFVFDRFHRNFPGTAVPNNASSFFAVPNATGVNCAGTGASAPKSADLTVCTMAALINNHTTTLTGVTSAMYTAARTQYVNALFGTPTQLGLYSISGPTPRTGDQDIFFPKVDWIVNQKNHASFSLNRMRWWSPSGIQTQATNNYGVRSFGNDYVKDTWFISKLDSVLSNNVTNQIRFQYGRDFEFQKNQDPTPYELATLISPVNATTGVATGYTNPYGLPPNVNVGSFQWGTANFLNRAAYPDEYKTQIADTVNVIKGKHTLKFGVDWVHTSEKINNLYQQFGQYSFSGLAQYFAQLYDPTHAYYTDYYQAFQGGSINNPVTSYTFSTKDFALFFQDDYKVARRLTVNVGLRYETEFMPKRYTLLTNSIKLGSESIDLGKLPKRPNGIGPRVGFAWDLFGDSKTVLRGGYGIYFGRIINSTLFSAMTNTGSQYGQKSYDDYKGATTSIGTALTNPFPQIAPTPGSMPAGSLTLNYFEPNFTIPQIHQVDLSLQRELGWNSVLSLTYMGSFGRHLQNFRDANLAAPGTPYCSTTATVTGITGRVPTGTYAAPNATTGACTGTNVLITPPSTASYTLTNLTAGNVAGNMPLTEGATVTVPFYTSRLNPNLKTVTEIYSGVNSNYNALSVQVEKRMSNHVQLSGSYTWSHALDYGVNNTTGSGTNNPIDPLNPNYGVYGNSNTNVPNRFTFHGVFESPFRANSWLKYLVEGWQAAPVVQIQTGLGQSVNTASSTPTVYQRVQSGSSFYNIAYKGASTGMLGGGGSWQIVGTGRNTFLQPATYVTDLQLAKRVTLREKYELQFSADAFNLFNHRNVTGITTTQPYTISSTAPGSSAAAGTYSSKITPNTSSSAYADGASLFMVPSSANSNFVYSTRQIQLGLRVRF